MEVARRTFGRWKPGHKDLHTQIVIERSGTVLLRFNPDALDELEQLALDLLREVAEWRAENAHKIEVADGALAELGRALRAHYPEKTDEAVWRRNVAMEAMLRFGVDRAVAYELLERTKKETEKARRGCPPAEPSGTFDSTE